MPAAMVVPGPLPLALPIAAFQRTTGATNPEVGTTQIIPVAAASKPAALAALTMTAVDLKWAAPA